MSSDHALLTLQPRRYAGREATLDKLSAACRALVQTNSKTRAIYVHGFAGLGKTRTLNWLADGRWHGADEDHPEMLYSGIIDFYDSETHSAIDLMERIARGVITNADGDDKDRLNKSFSDYLRLMESFRASQADAAFDSAGALREGIDAAFRAGWLSASTTHRTIITLDTAELLQYEEDPIQNQFRHLRSPASSRDRLIQMVKENWFPNTLVVVAGRTEPGNLDAGLGSLFSAADCFGLENLAAAEAVDYAESLQEMLHENGKDALSAQVRAVAENSALVEQLRATSSGNPIAFALALALYCHDADFMRRIDDGLEDSSHFKQTILKALTNGLLGDLGTPLRHMLLMPKGLTARRLQVAIEGDGQLPTKPQYEKDVLTLSKYVFVKSRPDGSIVCHDQLYEWADDYGQVWSEDARRQVLERLDTEYRREIKHTGDQIERLSSLPQLQGVEDIGKARDKGGQTPNALDDRELLRLRRLRRELGVQRLHYCLRRDCARGFHVYYELADEAESVTSPEYDAHIRSEFLQWWQKQGRALSANEAGLFGAAVLADLAGRWIERVFLNGGGDVAAAEKAIAFSDQLLAVTEPGDSLNSACANFGDLWRLRRYAMEGLARPDDQLSNLLCDFKTTSEAVRGQIQQFRKLEQSGDHATVLFSLKAGLAFGLYHAAKVARRLGDYDESLKMGRQSVALYRELNMDIGTSSVLNDLAYVMTLMDQISNAELLIDDALTIRRRLGFGRLIAYSLGTRAIMLAQSDRPVSAIESADLARHIFVRTNEPARGRALILRTLCEAHRRNAARPLMSLGERLKHLDTAIRHGEDAVNLQRSKDGAPVSARASEALSEALNELGCAYRDKAKVHHNSAEYALRDAAFGPAKDYLDEAFECVKNVTGNNKESDNFAFARANALVNKAYLHFFVGNQAESRNVIEDALGRVPRPLRELSDEDDHQKAIRTPANVRFLALLGKAHSLKLRLAGLVPQPEVPSPALNTILESAIWTLYYLKKHGHEGRMARESHRAAYDMLKRLDLRALQYLRAHNEPCARKLGLPKDDRFALMEFVDEFFGIEYGGDDL